MMDAYEKAREGPELHTHETFRPEAPAESENLPAMQSLHTDALVAPTAAENLPRSHLEHAPADVKEYLPASQAVQFADPVDALYFPA